MSTMPTGCLVDTKGTAYWNTNTAGQNAKNFQIICKKVDQSPELHISTKDEKVIGSYDVKITSTVGKDLPAARTIEFRTDFLLKECLDGKLEPTASLKDFKYDVIEK